MNWKEVVKIVLGSALAASLTFAYMEVQKRRNAGPDTCVDVTLQMPDYCPEGTRLTQVIRTIHEADYMVCMCADEAGEQHHEAKVSQ